VMSHGGGLRPEEEAELPGDALVVGYAPQLDLLKRAQLTLTHAGLNTVLDSLANGVPLVTVPITYEQPAIAQRVAWTGTGRSVAFAKLDVPTLRASLEAVLHNPGYRQAAQRLSKMTAIAGGTDRAASIIEASVAS
jgi:zeaxanthin glucosyltransferase